MTGALQAGVTGALQAGMTGALQAGVPFTDNANVISLS